MILSCATNAAVHLSNCFLELDKHGHLISRFHCCVNLFRKYFRLNTVRINCSIDRREDSLERQQSAISDTVHVMHNFDGNLSASFAVPNKVVRVQISN